MARASSRVRFLSLSSRRPVGARDAGHPGGLHGGDGGDLVAHETDGLRARTDEDETGALHPLGEIRVLGQEAVARVDGHGVGHLGRADDGRDIEITVAGRRRSDTDGLVGQQDVLQVPVRLGMDRDGADAELAAGAQDPERDLAPVGDENLLDHAAWWGGLWTVAAGCGGRAGLAAGAARRGPDRRGAAARHSMTKSGWLYSTG